MNPDFNKFLSSLFFILLIFFGVHQKGRNCAPQAS